jgi:hypothetical protein
MARMKALLVALLMICSPSEAQTFPIQINADHPGRVLVRVQGQDSQFQQISASHPAVYQASPGQRVDIRVVGRANWWANWSGEQQGCTGPSHVTIRLERTPAWDRLSLLGAGLGASLAVALLLWRRRAARAVAEAVRRAEVAESGTGIPKKIAGYSIIGLLGEGGMAHVYQGRDQNGLDFAVKVPKTVDERFVRECQIATTLDSPHIVRGYDFCAERAEGKPAYLAQELLVGQTLRERVEGTEGLPFAEVDRLFSQLLDGLEVAHGQGVLHRDLKPENLFLDRSSGKETLKILDFGVARADDALLVTVSGAMLGTPIYSSPEQNRSDKTDLRSDLYSLGLILYEMLTGRRTWTAANRYELLKLHNAGLQVEAVALRADLPAAWNDLVNQLLRTDPEQRPRDVAEVRMLWNQARPDAGL